jgi:hypothetical protein
MSTRTRAGLFAPSAPLRSDDGESGEAKPAPPPQPPKPLSERLRSFGAFIRDEARNWREFRERRRNPPPPPPVAGKKTPYIVRRRLLHPGAKPTFYDHDMSERYWEWEEELGGLEEINAVAAEVGPLAIAQEEAAWQAVRHPLPPGLARERAHLAMSSEIVSLALAALQAGGLEAADKVLSDKRNVMDRALTRLVHKMDIGYVLTPQEVTVRDWLQGGDDLTGLQPSQMTKEVLFGSYCEAKEELRTAVGLLYNALNKLDIAGITAAAGKTAVDELYVAERAAEEARLAAEREEEEKQRAAEMKAKKRAAEMRAKHAERMKMMEMGDAYVPPPPPPPEPETLPADANAAAAGPVKTPEELVAEAAEAARRAALDPGQDPEAPPVTRSFEGPIELAEDEAEGLPWLVYLSLKEWRRARGEEAVAAHKQELLEAKERQIAEAHAKRNASMAERFKEHQEAKVNKIADANKAADDFYKFLLEQGAPEEGAKAAADEKRELGLATAEEEIAAMAAEHQRLADEEREAILLLTGDDAAAEGEGEAEGGPGKKADGEGADAAAAAEGSADGSAAANPADAAKYGVQLPEAAPLVWERRIAAFQARLNALRPVNQLHSRMAELRTREEPWAKKVVRAYNVTLDFLDDWEEAVNKPVAGAPASGDGFFARRKKRRQEKRAAKILEIRGPQRGAEDVMVVKWLRETRENHPGFNSARFRIDFHKYTVWLFTTAYLTRNYQVMRSICDAATYERMVWLFNMLARDRPGQRMVQPSPFGFVIRKEPVFSKGDAEGSGSDLRWEYQFKFRYPRAFEDVKTGALTEGSLHQQAESICYMHATLDLENPDSNYKIIGAYFLDFQAAPPNETDYTMPDRWLPWHKDMTPEEAEEVEKRKAAKAEHLAKLEAALTPKVPGMDE